MSDELQIRVPLADLTEGRMVTCNSAGREILVCRTKEGVFAVDNICSHAHARLSEGRLRGYRAICPLHGAAFDVRTGAVLGAPATRPLTAFPVSVDPTHAKISVPAQTPPR